MNTFNINSELSGYQFNMEIYNCHKNTFTCSLNEYLFVTSHFGCEHMQGV